MAPRKQKEELQFFHQLATLAPSIWANFLTMCGNGKLPPKVKVTGDKIVYRRSANQQASTNVPTEITEDELERICNFFQKEVSILIDISVDESVVHEEYIREPLTIRLRRKKNKLRNLYLYKFVEYYACKHNLSNEQKEQLMLTVVLGTLSGVLNRKDYIISTDENGCEIITDIIGIKRDDHGMFYFDIRNDDAPRVKTRPPQKATLYDRWLKHIGRLQGMSLQTYETITAS